MQSLSKKRHQRTLLEPTPEQILGPYYPLTRDPNANSDLTRKANANRRAKGATLFISGTLMDRSGAAISAALIEAWQCDGDGIYPHPYAPDSAQVDPDFEGYGRSITTTSGTYSFTCLKPVSYPGRAPHLHLRVSSEGQEPLVTQMYIDGEPENETDFALWRAGTPSNRRILQARLRATPAGPVDFTGRFDIVVSWDQENG